MFLGKEGDVTLMPMFSHPLLQEVHPCIQPKTLSAAEAQFAHCPPQSLTPILKDPSSSPLCRLCGQDGVICDLALNLRA